MIVLARVVQGALHVVQISFAAHVRGYYRLYIYVSSYLGTSCQSLAYLYFELYLFSAIEHSRRMGGILTTYIHDENIFVCEW